MKDDQFQISLKLIQANGNVFSSSPNEVSFFAINDHVSISRCSTASNNGEYIVSSVDSSSGYVSLKNINGSDISGFVADTDCFLSRTGSRMLNFQANTQTKGAILDINMNLMESGTGLEVVGNTALTTGKLLWTPVQMLLPLLL